MRISVILAALAGLLATVWLVFHFGVHSIWGAVASVGWRGFAFLCLYGIANFFLLGSAWFILEPHYGPAKLAIFIWGRAVRDSAGEILPFSQLGGLVIGARATELCGIDRPTAFASTIVDMTLEMIAQIAFIICGLLILALQSPIATWHAPIVRTTFAGVIVGILIAGSLFVLQRRGFSFLERISERLMPSATGSVAALHQSLNRIHAVPFKMFAGFLLHGAGWIFSAFGTWLALDLVGMPLRFANAVMIEAILCAVRSAAIFVPGAIGVQEAAYMALMPFFGVPPQIGVAISLLKRAREVALGVPILLSWQIAESAGAVIANRNSAQKSIAITPQPEAD